jgi:glycine/D-amino acid oxidase-like deaminating enzyme
MKRVVGSQTVVVGAGIFGVTAALELRARGHHVRVMDPGPIPHPLAASTDISKVIRIEYGPDETYMALMEEAREGWLAWNERWSAAGEEALYHETGVVMVCREPMMPGGFEYESWEMLNKRGHRPERLDAPLLTARFPAWQPDRYVDGFFHAKGGYAESGRVVTALTREAAAKGVELLEGWRAAEILFKSDRVVGVRDQNGELHAADEVVIAAGAWTGKLAGNLVKAIRATGHPVFHLRPDDQDLFRAEWFPTFTADVARTGFYGFPLNRDGVVKVANHGVGSRIDPDLPRDVTRRDHQQLRRFLAETFPALVDAPVVFTRLCLYADTQDEDFWIARDPSRGGLTVASGGSGHGFKFAPVLGGLIADAVEGVDNPLLEKFRWRPEVSLLHGREAARCHVEEETS